MKKLAYTAVLAVVGLSLAAPAMANGYYNTVEPQPASRAGATCRVDTDGERHCWNHTHRWHADRQFVSQDGQDVNSNSWADGSARATLPPHNSRGTSRPDTGSDMDNVNWNMRNWW